MSFKMVNKTEKNQTRHFGLQCYVKAPYLNKDNGKGVNKFYTTSHFYNHA